MITTPQSLIDYIAERLNVYFNERRANGATYKTDDQTDTFNADVPCIYKYLVPPDSLNDSAFPNKLPSICIVISSIQPTSPRSQQVSLAIHTAVCNASTSDKETAEGNNTTGYTFKTTSEYTYEKAQQYLYEQSLLLGTQTLEAIQGIKLSGFQIDNLILTPPSVLLEDFPYSTSVIMCDITIIQSFASVNNQANELREKIDSLL